jgi:hypothetical protein
MGQCFRRWRSDLNKKYIQKGLTPIHEYGKVTLSQWAELVAKKTSPKALALSTCNSEQAKKNQHHPCLGPGGYAGKEEVFSKIDKGAEALGNTKVKSLKPCIHNWIYVRSVDSSGSSLKFAKPETEEAVSRILKYTKDKEKGTFTPSRERYELSLGLGNPEHTGRTRGLGKLTSWKHEFKEDRHMYKKYGRDRESNLEIQVKALVAKVLGELALVGRPLDVPSSQGSTAATAPSIAYGSQLVAPWGF